MTRKKYSRPTSQKAIKQHDLRGRRKEVNVRDCTECKAKVGETCYRMTATRFLELDKTHATLREEELR